jgi:CheY-specific phosphatase CheX
MSQSLAPEALAGVTRSVLETAAFLFCDEVPSDVEPQEGPVIEASISFQAATSGRLVLRLPLKLGLEAAANLLGIEPDEPEAAESARAAVGELLNMISGSALQAWFGAGASYSMGVPATVEVAGTLPSGRPGTVAFVVDEVAIEVEAVETA